MPESEFKCVKCDKRHTTRQIATQRLAVTVCTADFCAGPFQPMRDGRQFRPHMAATRTAVKP